MASIKRKQFKPKRLSKVCGAEMQRSSSSNEEAMDLSRKQQQQQHHVEILDLSSKKLNNEKENKKQLNDELSQREHEQQPLDLRINCKKEDSMLKSSPTSSLSMNITRLVRGQDEWMNNSRNYFIYQILKCLVCSKSFPTLNELSLHMLESRHFSKIGSTFAESTFPLDIQKNCVNTKTTESKKVPSTKSSSSSSKLLCLICKKSFSNGADLVEHLQNCHTISQICTTCGAYFETATAYSQHLIDEDYHHHHNHHRSKQVTANQKGVKRERENETPLYKRLKREGTGDGAKNPLLALELFVSSNEITKTTNTSSSSVSSNNSSNDSKKVSKLVENPLNLLQKMHSNFTNYVF